MGINLKLSSSANGTRNTGPVNMGGGSNLVQRSLFSTNTPNLAYSQWYTPGSGSPAVSTSDYYHINGIYWSRPYDLDAMGSEGATIKAREGMRYVWIFGSDHPSNTNFADGGNFYVGYSNDPQVWPATIATLRNLNAVVTVVDQNGFTQTNLNVYHTPHLVYNPDSAGDKFWIYAEGSASNRQHELCLFTTADFLTTTLVEPVIPTTNFGGWSSFGKPQRLGTGNWVVHTLGKPDGSGPDPVPSQYKYTSTDGVAWTPDYSRIVAGPGPFVTISGQDYMIAKETAAANEYLSLLAVDANKVSSGTYTRISTAFGNNTGNATVYPGPTYFQDLDAYEEDGVASIYVTRGFFSGVTNSLMQGPYLNNYPTFYNMVGSITGNTTLTVTSRDSGSPPLAIGHRILFLANSPIYITAFGTGTGDTGTYTITSTNNAAAGTTFTVACNGGLFHQFVDQYYYITNATTAANAAPLGVTADCAGGVVSVSWNNCLPNNTYRVYRGTTAGSQPTLVGDVTGTSTTFSLASNAQCFIKVVTLNAGVEQGSRVVNCYSSNYTRMVNRHVNRVINDGGDTSKIDFTFLASVDSYLTSNDYWKYLLFWVDVRFGIKTDGSGFISKIYCLGTTQLPRGGDYTPTTSNTYPSTSSNTSYSATSFRGTTPSWVNNAGTARGYFGNGRGNTIQRKNEITLIAAYQKPSSSGTASFFGMGQFSGLNLSQASGASGNIIFNLYHQGPAITATVPFSSATSAHVAAGVFDGTNVTAYLDGVAGTPVDGSAANNTDMTKSTTLRGIYTTSLDPTTAVDTLMSGTNAGRVTPSTRAYNTSDNMGQFTGACLAGFEKGSAQIVSDITAMYA